MALSPILTAALVGTGIIDQFTNQNRLAILGDSRAAQGWLDGANPPSFRKSGSNHLGWALALSGQRAAPTGNFGKSGDRTDQIAARLSAALASGAGRLFIIAGNNDIGQDYPTATTSGATSAAAIIAWVDQAYSQNKMNSLVALEAGTEGWTGTKLAQLKELNRRLRDAASVRQHMDLLDLPSVFWVDGKADTTIAFKPNIMLDGTHEAVLGGYVGGKLMAKMLTATLPLRAVTPVNNILLNPNFSTLTGGTVGAGASGSVPASWVARRGSGGSGTQAIAVSSGPDGSGGTEIILDCTFAAAGDTVLFNQDFAPAAGPWNTGDVFVPSVDLIVDDGGVNLSNPSLSLILAYDSTSLTQSDIETTTNGLGPAEGYRVNLLGPARAVPTMTSKTYMSFQVIVKGAGAGTARIRVRKPVLDRTPA